MTSCFEPVRVQREGSLARFNRLDEILRCEIIVIFFHGILLNLIACFTQGDK
jgi:hypothetical protein